MNACSGHILYVILWVVKMTPAIIVLIKNTIQSQGMA